MPLVRLQLCLACHHACLRQPDLLSSPLSCPNIGVLNVQILRERERDSLHLFQPSQG